MSIGSEDAADGSITRLAAWGSTHSYKHKIVAVTFVAESDLNRAE